MAGHTPLALPQMPQVGLQQRSPAAHVVLPQRTPASLSALPLGTHIGCGGHGARMHCTSTS